MNLNDKETNKKRLDELVRLHHRIADLESIILDYKESEKTVAGSEICYRRLFETARDGILILNADTGRITDINPSLVEMLGSSRDEVLGKGVGEIVYFNGVDLSMSSVNELLDDGNLRYGELLLGPKKGLCIKVEIAISSYLVKDKRVIHCNIRDITERRKAEAKLKQLSTSDELTGLHNLMFFDAEMSRLSRGRQFPMAVIIAHVDGIREVNDSLGHAVGDELLKRASAVLRETFRAEELMARVGGDEFAVLLPKTDAVTAELALNRTRINLQFHNSTYNGPRLSLSLGAAAAKTSQLLAEALKQADERMYREKAAHKLGRINHLSHDLQLIFLQVDQKLTANPGMHISKLALELACERHLIERAVKVAKSKQFREYQQVKRLEAARYLLAERHLLIKEIAAALGYKSPASVWRLLKTRMGNSPSGMRARNDKDCLISSANVG